MRTVVRALSDRRVRDGWGNEVVLRRPEVEAGEAYLVDMLMVDKKMNCTVVRKLKTQDELMDECLENIYVLQRHDYYTF